MQEVGLSFPIGVKLGFQLPQRHCRELIRIKPNNENYFFFPSHSPRADSGISMERGFSPAEYMKQTRVTFLQPTE